MKHHTNDNRRKPQLTTTQLVMGALTLLAFDIGLDGYLDTKQAMEKQYIYQIVRAR